jgi:hypothetical protein
LTEDVPVNEIENLSASPGSMTSSSEDEAVELFCDGCGYAVDSLKSFILHDPCIQKYLSGIHGCPVSGCDERPIFMVPYLWHCKVLYSLDLDNSFVDAIRSHLEAHDHWVNVLTDYLRRLNFYGITLPLPRFFTIDLCFKRILAWSTNYYDERYFQWGEAIYRVCSERSQKVVDMKELLLKGPPGLMMAGLSLDAANKKRMSPKLDCSDDKARERSMRCLRDLSRGFLYGMWEDEQKSMTGE